MILKGLSRRPKASVLVLFLVSVFSLVVRAQPKLEPIPPNLKIAEQDESPILLTPMGVHDFGNGYKHLQYTAHNTGSKIVWGFVLTGLEQANKSTIILGTAIQPNAKQNLGARLIKTNEASPQVVGIDLVLFRDGTHWGPGSVDESELLRGIFVGQRAVVSEVRQILNRNDDAALREHLTREPYLLDPARIETKTKRGEGFTKGYGAGIINLRRDLLGRGDLKGIPFRISEMEENLGLAAPLKDGRKQISRDYWFNEPIKIEGMFRGDKPVEVDEKFSSDLDWLRGLRLRIKNNSGKSITHLSVGLDFPETTATGNIMLFPLKYGPHPASSRPPSEKVRAEVPILPDGTFEIVLDNIEFGALKKFVESRHPLDSLKRVNIRISGIYFSDGTAWNGSWLKQDPSDSRRWLPVAQR